MNTLHFVHTSDWHLGFYQYNKRERFNDFSQAADKVVEKIIEINPDFILHTGDIFHHPKPSPETLRSAVRILKKLEEKEIPLFIVRGNHDGKVSKHLKRGGGIISLLKDLELIKYIDDEVLEIEDLECSIMGVGYYPGKQVATRIEELIQENPDFILSEKFRILGIHGFVEGQLEETHQISLKKITEVGVDYFGAGHYHIPWYDEKKHIYAPGSSETTAITDSIRGDNIDSVSMYSSFFEVKVTHDGSSWSDTKLQIHKIPVRPKIHLFHSSDKESVDKIRVELEEMVSTARKVITSTEVMLSMMKPILNVRLETQLEFDQMSKINLEEWFGDQFLHIISHVDGKTNVPEFKTDLGQSKDKEEVIMELIQQNGLDPKKHTTMIVELLSSFGDYSTSRTLSEDIILGIKNLLLENKQNIVLIPKKKKKIKEDGGKSDSSMAAKKKSKKKKKEEKLVIAETKSAKSESIDDVSKALGLDDFDL